MADGPPDPLGGELTVRAQIDQAGLTVAAKSRALNAIDRLIGAAIDILGSRVEGISGKQRATNAAREEVIRAAGAAVAEQIGANPDMATRAMEALLGNELRKQANREAVAAAAIEDLRDPQRTVDATADEEALDEDWLNVFGEYAERASSARLRDLWGRVLAGQVRKPGTFSLATIRVMAELDQEIAESFQDAVALRFVRSFIKKPENLKNELLVRLSELEESGFLQGVSGPVNIRVDVEETGFAFLANGSRGLRLYGPKGYTYQLDVIRITRVGQQIASLFPECDPAAPLRDLVPALSPHFHRIELIELEQVGPELFKVLGLLEVLKNG